MSRVLCGAVLAALVLCVVPTSAMAQEGETPSQFMTLEGIEIHGEARGAQIMQMKAPDRARFERLGTLKRSMLGKVVDSGQDQALSR